MYEDDLKKIKTEKEAIKLAKAIGWTGEVCANSCRDIVAGEEALDELADKFGFDVIKHAYQEGIREGEKYEQ